MIKVFITSRPGSMTEHSGSVVRALALGMEWLLVRVESLCFVIELNTLSIA